MAVPITEVGTEVRRLQLPLCQDRFLITHIGYKTVLLVDRVWVRTAMSAEFCAIAANLTARRTSH